MTTRLETQGVGMRTAGWCAALLAGFCWLAAVPVLADEPPTLVEVSEVRRDKVRDELVTFGALRSDESVMIRPELAGRLASLHFREGQQVAAGDLLVSLDDAIASAELAQAKANLSLAERSAQRTRQLYQRGASNAQALDEAQANLQLAAASVLLAEARLDKTRIRAPYAGTLGLRQVSPGDYLQAGQDIVNLEVLDPLKLDFRIPQKTVSQLRIGQAVEVTVDSQPGQRFEARVQAINPRLDEAGRSQAVRAQLDNHEGRLYPGQFVRVAVIVEERTDAMLVPEEAVMSQGEQRLLSLVEQGKVRRQVVRLGLRRDGWVEVREGLRGDEQVIRSGWHKVFPGDPVRVRSAPAQAARP